MLNSLSLISASILYLIATSFSPYMVSPQTIQINSSSQKSGRDIGSPEAEIMRRAEIRHAEDVHKEMVERAEETHQIGGELLASFEKTQRLSRDDLKKLERMEKLTRKIRGGAGGSDDDAPIENPPTNLETALKRLVELSDNLNKSVQKTSRLVISASVINTSNEMIELIRLIRSFLKH